VVVAPLLTERARAPLFESHKRGSSYPNPSPDTLRDGFFRS
jgi:hypothetical protein